MADFNKPDKSVSLWSNILSELRSARESVAKMFDGGAGDINIPVDAKRIDNATGEVLNYNGATWDSLGVLGVDTTARDAAIAAQESADEIAASIGGSDPSVLPFYYVGLNATGDGSGSSTANRLGQTGVRTLVDSGLAFVFFFEAGTYGDIFTSVQITGRTLYLVGEGVVTIGGPLNMVGGILSLHSVGGGSNPTFTGNLGFSKGLQVAANDFVGYVVDSLTLKSTGRISTTADISCDTFVSINAEVCIADFEIRVFNTSSIRATVSMSAASVLHVSMNSSIYVNGNIQVTTSGVIDYHSFVRIDGTWTGVTPTVSTGSAIY